MKWNITTRPLPNSIDTTVYTSVDGKWTLCKEFYAQGPSLFSWMLYRGTHEFVEEFNTKKQASTYVDNQT